jgi:hypothetical protein
VIKIGGGAISVTAAAVILYAGIVSKIERLNDKIDSFVNSQVKQVDQYEFQIADLRVNQKKNTELIFNIREKVAILSKETRIKFEKED